MCIPDFDEATGFCDEDSPRRAEVEAAKAQQSAAALKGIADVFGISGAIKQGMAAAQAQAAAGMAICPNDGTQAAAGTRFCPNCGAQMTQPVAATAATPVCANCGSAMAAGVRFCPNCGTPAAQPSKCANCGIELAAGVKFCPNCGTAT